MFSFGNLAPRPCERIWIFLMDDDKKNPLCKFYGKFFII